MPTSLLSFLKQRAERASRHFAREISQIDVEEALRDRHPDWPTQEFGIGQDGSILGIVLHIAAWKQITLPLFAPEGRMLSEKEWEQFSTPEPDDWQGVCAWYKQVSMAWNAEMAALSDGSLEETRPWANNRISLADFIAEMTEHELMHQSQVEYLRQRHRVEGKTDSPAE